MPVQSGSVDLQMETSPLSSAETQPPRYAVAPEGSPTDELTFMVDDIDIWEDNLPACMAKIEAGSFRTTKAGSKQWVVKRKRAKVMVDGDGDPILSLSTGRPIRFVPTLPRHIPQSVSPWRILYWDRKAAKQSVRLTHHDLVDRMSFDHQLTAEEAEKKANMLSMRVQRYTPGIGQLATFDRSKTAFPSEQSMRTLEGLYVLQAMLNTWYLPMNFTNEGPWCVVQPQSHPSYRFTDAAHSNYQGSSYLIEKKYGLSDRVQELANGLLFLELKAEQAGLAPKDKFMFLSDLRLGSAKKKGARSWFLEDFERWREGSPNTPSIGELREALDNASSQAVVHTIMGGDLASAIDLQNTEVALMGAMLEAHIMIDDGKVLAGSHHRSDSAVAFEETL